MNAYISFQIVSLLLILSLDAYDQKTTITPGLLHLLKKVPETKWGKNILEGNENYKGIKAEAFGHQTHDITYHVYLTSVSIDKLPIEKLNFYFHRYQSKMKRPTLTTNIWLEDAEAIKKFESCYGISQKHDDNETAADFKASLIDYATTCSYWDTSTGRRYTLLTTLPLIKFKKELEIH